MPQTMAHYQSQETQMIMNWYKQQLALITLILSVMTPTIVTANAPSLDDFAYTASLTSGKTSLRQIDLPVDVYTKMYRGDYGDLRIFSADAQLVPHQFSRAETSSSTELVNLNFYPFNKQQANDDGNIRIEINQTTGQQQLKINQSLESKNDNKVEYQYIIENSPLQKQYQSLCKVKLYWQQSQTSLILGLKLESSKDLQNWTSLSKKLNVSRLNYGDSQLVRDEVEFSCTSQPYLRLTWLNQSTHDKVSLSSIQGFYTHKNGQKTQWKRFEKPTYNKQGHWLFESNVVAPLVQMEFKAPQNGLLYKGKIFSRPSNDQAWRYRDQVTQYRLNLGDSELQSNPFSLGAINDRYWKFEPTIETQYTDSQLPQISAAWRSNKVLFIAQGNPPFTLAFGNPNVLPAKNSDLNNLIQSLQESGSTVDAVNLMSIEEGAQSFNRDGKSGWKKIALWIVLLLGTLMMGLMAYRLYKQMGVETEQETEKPKPHENK